MWIIVLFDLPTVSKTERRAYTVFRKHLLNDGFNMMQFSVYMRHCASEANAQVHETRIQAALPSLGEVRVIKITDKQFGKIQVFYGKKRKKTEIPPLQMDLF